MTHTSERRWPVSRRTLYVVAAAFGVGLIVGFFAVVLQEHHHLPWGSVLFSAPVYVLARLILGHGIVYSWSKVFGTAFLYAVYAYFLTDSRLKRGWLYVLVIHGACAIALALIPQMQ